MRSAVAPSSSQIRALHPDTTARITVTGSAPTAFTHTASASDCSSRTFFTVACAGEITQNAAGAERTARRTSFASADVISSEESSTSRPVRNTFVLSLTSERREGSAEITVISSNETALDAAKSASTSPSEATLIFGIERAAAQAESASPRSVTADASKRTPVGAGSSPSAA